MTVRRILTAISVAAPLVALVIVAAPRGTAADPVPHLLELSGDISSHDPHIIKAGGAYYVFSSGSGILSSKDLHHWTRVGRLLETAPDWLSREMDRPSGGRGGGAAPDVAFFNGRYNCYYSVYLDFSRNTVVGLATNKTLDPTSPDYKWEDGGMVLRSSGDTDWNALDGGPVIEDENNVWLVFGSFWSGIKMRRIDPKTGLLSTTDTTMYNMAAGPRTTSHEIGTGIEGSYMFRHAPYWYLFASLDECCSGDRSTYEVIVGRSRDIRGPFVDKKGIPMIEGGGSMVIHATTPRWREPGHNSALHDETGDYFVFHATPGTVTGITGSRLFISTIVWEDGWPRVAELP